MRWHPSADRDAYSAREISGRGSRGTEATNPPGFVAPLGGGCQNTAPVSVPKLLHPRNSAGLGMGAKHWYGRMI
jgi:hypothetical protein